MMCEELLQALVQYQMQQGEKLSTLRLNQDYYKTVLEQLAYPDWLIEKKIKNLDQTFLGVEVELTSEVETFEMRRIKKWQNFDRFLAKRPTFFIKACYICIMRSGGKHNSLCFS
ncbi:hypothetical protein [Bacillus thuringiensis]|uniref:hypothetical protein n=1 Tax=Bacillus thuringiensis TaxID=1428 RepID=UPI001E2EC853|nr:hypothetical protein [Bacillus thuringiensis]